jgi:hypothetical protein
MISRFKEWMGHFIHSGKASDKGMVDANVHNWDLGVPLIWQGWFKYTFGKGAGIDDRWHFDRPSDWQFFRPEEELEKDTEKRKEKLQKEVEKRKKLIDARMKLIDKQSHLFECISFWHKSVTESNDILFWFNKSNNNVEGPPASKPHSVLLNNVLTSEKISSFSILPSHVNGHLTIQMLGLPDGHPCWVYEKFKNELELLDEYIFVFPELFFEYDEPKGRWTVIEDEARIQDGLDILRYHRLLHECSILAYVRNRPLDNNNNESVTIKIRDKVTLVRYKKARFCHCIPIPGKPIKTNVAPPLGVTTPEVVISSPNTHQTLESLCRVWQDPFAKSVLLSAPPGSGKDGYALSIPYGNGRVKEGDVPTVAFSVGTKEDLEKQLFGYREPGGTIRPGLIARAAKKALFLDEVHYPDYEPGIRASLLRTFESDDFTPVGAIEVEKVDKVLFILATSRKIQGQGSSGKSLSEISPPDFWTRMTHVVEMEHPLDPDRFPDCLKSDQAKIREIEINVLRNLFKCFWWQRAEAFFELSVHTPRDKLLTPGDALKFDHMKSMVVTEPEENPLENMAKTFAEKLRDNFPKATNQPSQGTEPLCNSSQMTGCASNLRNLSIRGIRTMVTRLFSNAFTRVLRGEEMYEEKTFDEQLDAVFKEILPISQLENTKSSEGNKTKWSVTIQESKS